ncbi:hypothetical protein D3C86_2085850 [compost metagenome]
MAFDQQARNLAQRIVRRDGGIGGPDVFDHELEIELFFRHDDAHLAHIRAVGAADQFHTTNFLGWGHGGRRTADSIGSHACHGPCLGG